MIGVAAHALYEFLLSGRLPGSEQADLQARMAEANKQRAIREYRARHQYGEFTEVKPLPSPILALPPPKS